MVGCGSVVDMTLHPLDDMIDLRQPAERELAHYEAVGRGAVASIRTALRERVPHRILDMPCGFGRVVRHLRAEFEGAEIVGCDIEAAKVEFCAAQFGATPLLSSYDFSTLDLGSPYDVIWCGSLLTHLDESAFRQCLDLFSRSLATNGVALVTVHGRFAPIFQRDVCGYLPHDLFAQLEADYSARGFGYRDYVGETGYGVSVSAPSFVLRCLELDPTITVRGYVERGWDDHQDVVVFEKRPIDAAWENDWDRTGAVPRG